MPEHKNTMKPSVSMRLSLVGFAAPFAVIGFAGIWTGTPAWVAAGYATVISLIVVPFAYWWVVRPASMRVAEVLYQRDMDVTTRLLNRHGITVKLLEFMALADRYGNRLSVALVGVDRVPGSTSDVSVDIRALQTVAGVLAETIRAPDRIGRYMDDGFLAILPETSMSGACRNAERIRQVVAGTRIDCRRQGDERITVSIGVTVFRRGEDIQRLLQRAGKALERARARGCNRVLSDLAA